MKILEINHLKKYFPTPRGTVHAVDDVSFSIEEGTTMGIVGESGCGKSTLGKMIVHLEDSTEGNIVFKGKDVTAPGRAELKKYRESVQMIFQDPYSSLDPRMTIEEIIQEPLIISGRYNKAARIKRTAELMDIVGIDKRLVMSYPHELDGGQRQRVGIARALALDPDLIVCDEPVSALDVSIQAQVINLLQDLQKEKKLTYIFVTHDMSVVRHISDDISVMYLGQLVEKSRAKELFKKPYHPYTKALLSAIPTTNIDKKMNRIAMKGEISSPINPKPGCRFADRCIYACEKCHQPQSLEEIEPGHFVSCCRVREINEELKG